MRCCPNIHALMPKWKQSEDKQDLRGEKIYMQKHIWNNYKKSKSSGFFTISKCPHLPPFFPDFALKYFLICFSCHFSSESWAAIWWEKGEHMQVNSTHREQAGCNTHTMFQGWGKDQMKFHQRCSEPLIILENYPLPVHVPHPSHFPLLPHTHTDFACGIFPLITHCSMQQLSYGQEKWFALISYPVTNFCFGTIGCFWAWSVQVILS